jgi:hypothetical protein
MLPDFLRLAAWSTLRSTAWRLKPLAVIAFLIGTLLGAATSLPLQAATDLETPVPVVTDNVEQWSVGAGLLYWGNNCFGDEFNPYAMLKRKPTSGGIERTIESITDGQCLTHFSQLVSGDGLYYFDQSQSRIERMPLGEPYTPVVVKELIAAQFPNGRPFIEANGYLYWASYDKIHRTLKDGTGEIETVAETNATLSDILLVGNSIFWSDSMGIFAASINCESLPCSGRTQYTDFTVNTSGHGLVYQPSSGGGPLGGGFRLYWVQRESADANPTYTIRYRSCSAIAICFTLPPEGQLSPPPPLFFGPTTPNWSIGYPVVTNNNMYWTINDNTLPATGQGEVRRKALNSTGTSAEEIATLQGNIDRWLYVANDKLFFARRNIGIYTLSPDAAPITRDFEVSGMEVTQGIQNLASNVPLVAKKTTYVRAYGKQLTGPSAPTVEMHLVGTLNGTPLPGSPLKPVNGVRSLVTGGSFDRAKLNDGWYFLLPSNWTSAGAISLKVEIDPRQMHTDTNLTDNSLTQTVSYQNQPPVCVWTVPVRTHNAKPSTTDPNFWSMISHFNRRWPIPDTWIFRNTDSVEELEFCSYYGIPYPCFGPYELTDGWGIQGPPDRDKVIVSLWGRAQLSFNPDSCDDIGAPVHFMGMVHPDASTGGVLGYASTVSNQSWVKLPGHVPNPFPSSWNAIKEGSTMAQELAHNYGRQHIDCGNPEDVDTGYPYPPCQIANSGANSYYGFDVTTRQPIRPDQTADFMTYTNRSWVSDYTWRALLGSFVATNLASMAAAPEPAAAGDSVFVSGLVDTANNRGEISLVVILPTESVPPGTRQMLNAQMRTVALPTHGEAPHALYTLRLLDPQGTALVTRTLTLIHLDDHDEDNDTSIFSDLFPPPSGEVATIQLLADGVVIDSRTSGINKPTVSIQQPASGAVIENTLTIQWTASDPDPADRLLFTVQYSHDNGNSWHTVSLNVPSRPDPVNTLTLNDLGSLHGSDPNTARIRVLASDGYNTTIATSQPFTLNNRPPLPVIIVPSSGQSFAAGPALLLQGTATDAEDGGLSGNSLKWQVDGVNIGSGQDVIAAGIGPGLHTAALGATDSNNQIVTTTVNFNVSPLTIPHAAAPLLDGLCNDEGYANGSLLQLKPYSDDTVANVQLLRSDDYLWLCFSALKQGAVEPGGYAGLRADINNSRDPLAQVSDIGFFVGEDGDVFTKVGDDAGDLIPPGPAGLQGQISMGPNSTWNAELRIAKAALGDWDHLVGMAFGHHSVAQADDDYVWPYNAQWAKPNTWAATALGNQPVITLLQPYTATVLSASLAMTVEGSSFVSGTTVLWNGSALPTTFVDSEHLTAQVAAAQLTSAGLVTVTTRSPAPGNFTSNPLPFFIEPLRPQITALSPASAEAEDPTLTLTIDGSNFAADAKVLWNGTYLTPQSVTSTQIKVQIDAALLEIGQTIGVAVANQQPDERVSPTLPFEVQASEEEEFAERSYLPGIVK